MIPAAVDLADPAEPRAATLAEVVTLAAALVVAVVGTSSLLLAQLDVHSGGAALLLAAALLAPVAWCWWHERAPVRLAPGHLLLAGALGLASLVMFLPGFPYAYADKDPGVYIAHSWAIAREGSVQIDDPVLEADLPGVLFSPGARFPGIWIEAGDTDQVTPQFFHFFPALLATGVDLGGQSVAFHVNPLLGALSVVAFALAARRAFGSVTAAVAGGLLAISMPEVWQAKYPSTEIVAQLMIGAALLAIVVAIEARSRAAALVGGLLIGTGLLARPDGLILVLLAAGFAGLLLALDRFGPEAKAGAVGLAVSLPYALYNAYDLRRLYTIGNEVPDLPVVTAVAAGCLVGGRLLRRPATALWDQLVRRRDTLERWAGVAITAVFALLLLGFALRERLRGEAFTNLLGVEPTRSYDEMNLERLTFYLTRAIVPLAIAGLLVVGWERWRLARWVLLVPGLLMTPLYLWEAQISPRMMWWVRRFVPGVVPVLILLAAVAIGWALQRRQRLVQLGAAVLLLVLAQAFLDRSWPLRAHRELGGSFTAAQEIASSASPHEGLFLWERPAPGAIYDASRNLGAVVWFGFDQRSALLPEPADQASVEAYARQFPDREVFVVSSGASLPEGLEPGAFQPARQVQASLPLWREDVLALPRSATAVPVDVTVWRYEGSPGQGG